MNVAEKRADIIVGRILDELKELGLDKNTLVIFTSDHGDMNAGHGLMDKTVPTCWEEIVRVPLLMRLPGVIPAGCKTDVKASSVDLAPTILDLLAAAALDGMHGRSLRPFLTGARDDGRPVFVERGDPGKNCARMIRAGDWKLILQSRFPHELYDLTQDPGETRNLTADPAHQARFDDLRIQLRQHMASIGDPALTGALKDALA